MKKETKAVWGWAIYDWANSAFATTVMAGFFPVFFKEYWSTGIDVNESTAMLGLGNSAASLMVALLAPVLGAMADRGAARKKFLIGFAYLGVLMTASLFLVGKGQWPIAIFLYAMGVIGFSGANIFYDSLLPSITGEHDVDVVSGMGFSLGYLGGGLLLLINVLMTIFPEVFGLPDVATAVRYAFVTVALWWGGFTILTIRWVPEPVSSYPISERHIITDGIRQFMSTLRKLRSLKTVFLFLVAYWCYIDGVDTIVRMAVDYGLSIGFSSRDLILALLIVQFTGFPAALGFGKLANRWGVRKSIYLAIGMYILITLAGTAISSPVEFYVLACAIGLVQGGIQALSRSYYSRLIPAEHAGEFFGFYNMLGKFAAIIGPVMMGLVSLSARRILMPESPSIGEILEVSRLASRWGIGSITLLFVAGGILFYFVDEEKGRLQAMHFLQQSEPQPRMDQTDFHP